MNTIKNAHIPAPWELQERTDSLGNPVGFQIWGRTPQTKSGRCLIASTPDRFDPIAESNARLMAASPEMVEAIKMAVAWLTNASDLKVLYDRMPRGVECIDDLKQALYKAGAL